MVRSSGGVAGSRRPFEEIGDSCYVGRYPEWDVSVGVVLGSAGVLVVDTRASARQGAALIDDVRRLAPRRAVRWVVNTHLHFDHTFGNVAFDGAAVFAHENAAASFCGAADRLKRLITEQPDLDRAQPEITAQVLADVVDTPLRAPDATFSSVATINLGDRYVELFHPGPGHTDGDAVVRVPDADVVFAGDLVEESGPPGFGDDSYPLQWAASLDLVIGVLTDASVVVPGHGAVVDKRYVDAQRGDIADVATQIQALFDAGVPLDDADRAGETWPFPADSLRTAIARGYQELAAGQAVVPPGVPTLPLA